jgi:RNA polymerase-binding transcription factor DksA
VGSKQLDRFRKALLRQAQQIRAGYSPDSADDMPGGNGTKALNGGEEGAPDLAIAVALRERDRLVHEQILAAWSRIENGTFGRCTRCQQEIGSARLQAVPYTPFCVECARSEDVARAPLERAV